MNLSKSMSELKMVTTGVVSVCTKELNEHDTCAK